MMVDFYMKLWFRNINLKKIPIQNSNVFLFKWKNYFKQLLQEKFIEKKKFSSTSKSSKLNGIMVAKKHFISNLFL